MPSEECLNSLHSLMTCDLIGSNDNDNDFDDHSIRNCGNCSTLGLCPSSQEASTGDDCRGASCIENAAPTIVEVFTLGVDVLDREGAVSSSAPKADRVSTSLKGVHTPVSAPVFGGGDGNESLQHSSSFDSYEHFYTAPERGQDQCDKKKKEEKGGEEMTSSVVSVPLTPMTMTPGSDGTWSRNCGSFSDNDMSFEDINDHHEHSRSVNVGLVDVSRVEMEDDGGSKECEGVSFGDSVPPSRQDRADEVEVDGFVLLDDEFDTPKKAQEPARDS
jgi:hypothetical protein